MTVKAMTPEDRAALIAGMTPEERARLLGELNSVDATEKQKQKEAYEELRAGLLAEIRNRLGAYVAHGREFKGWLRENSDTFGGMLKEYGQLRRDDQLGFTLADDDFRFHVKGCRVKGFDERADVAAKRLTEFLRGWVRNQPDGEENPMYRLAMTMIQRNEAGDLDYKSISRLYEIEGSFNDAEYSEIMRLFKESNVVESTATHFYFEDRDHNGKWRRIEPSFSRL